MGSLGKSSASQASRETSHAELGPCFWICWVSLVGQKKFGLQFRGCPSGSVHRLFHESELWKSKAGVLVYKDRGGLKIDLATGQN